MESSRPTRAPFPQNPEDFDADDRISFSKATNKFIIETEDGEEFEYEEALKRWVPVLDDELLEQQQKAYAVQGVDESEPAMPPKKKRKGDNTENDHGNPKQAKHAQERKNKAIYVTNLPLNTDVEEVHHVFSRCGMIAEEIDSGKPRVKLYTDGQGRFKGDALIVYFRAESVDLAIQMLDDTDFRLGQGAPAGKMKVAAADFSYKTQRDAPSKPNEKEKQKIIKKTQKLNSKLADWDDDDPQTIQRTSKWDKIVVLKHMFTLDELKSDPDAIFDIKEDIREECGKLGSISDVILYDKEPDGIATVKFEDPDAADACIRLMSGRMFAGQQVIAHLATGHERFKKSRGPGDRAEGEDEEDVQRTEEAADGRDAQGEAGLNVDVGEGGEGEAGSEIG